MATKPSKSTEWASNASALKIDPSADQQSYGWSTSDNTVSGVPVKPNLQNQNGWQNAVHQWKEYFEDVTDDALKWHEATASATLTAASPRKWYVQGQTSEIVLTIDGTGIKKGDLFKFKNNKPEDPAQWDEHILHVKTQDANVSLIIWLMSGDSCVIKANKDNPSITTDWELIDLKRTTDLHNLLTFEKSNTLTISSNPLKKIFYVDAHNKWYGVPTDSLTWLSTTSSESWNETTETGIAVVALEYIEAYDILIMGINTARVVNDFTNEIRISTDKGSTWSTVYSWTGTFDTIDDIYYLPIFDRIVVVSYSTFHYSNDGGNTWFSSSHNFGTPVVDTIKATIWLHSFSTSGFIYSDNGGFSTTTTREYLQVYNANGLKISTSSGNFEIRSIFYNEYQKKYFLIYTTNDSLNPMPYFIAFSFDGYHFYTDGSTTDFYTNESIMNPDFYVQFNQVKTPFATGWYNTKGDFYIMQNGNDLTRLKMNRFANPNESSLTRLYGSGYSLRQNRILIDEDDGINKHILRSGRKS